MMDVKSLENIISIPSSARGLRIFVVDPDTSSLMCTASILERQSYKVTTTEFANIALSLIREREKQYDLVIAEVDMPQMDGFTFLNHMLRETDIPIILMSHKANLEMAMRALEEGACFFWQKPLREKDLINVWQHIFHNKFKAKLQKVNKRNLTFEEEGSFTEKNKRNNCQVKRKEEDEVCINKLEQKQRLIWTPQLHLKFLQAVNALGDENKAQPNAILKLMNVPNLTHRHVASHLQKHRLSVMRKKMDFSLPNSNIPTTSKAQANIDNTKELLKDVKSNCSAGESNSRSTTNSSCDIGGVVNFQEGNHYSPGLERQDQFSMGQTENQNNMLEYFEQVPNLEVNDVTMDDLSSLENISMCVSEIMKILEED